MRSATSLVFGGLLILSTAAWFACGRTSATENAEAAQKLVMEGKFAAARKLCEETLATEDAKKDKALSLRLERYRLEAIASDNLPKDEAAAAQRKAEVLATLARLAETYPTQAGAPLFAMIAEDLGRSGDLLAAIDVVEAGKKRFPTMNSAFDEVLEYIKKAAAGNDAATEKLKQLGYL
jgi:hypothetical protein